MCGANPHLYFKLDFVFKWGSFLVAKETDCKSVALALSLV